MMSVRSPNSRFSTDNEDGSVFDFSFTDHNDHFYGSAGSQSFDPYSYSFDPFQQSTRLCNEVDVDFTPFLERLEKDDLGHITALSQQLMLLIARHFHDKITIVRDDAMGEWDESGAVVVSVDPMGIRTAHFLHEADQLLGDREDLKIAIRSLLPPTLGTSAQLSPLKRRKRKDMSNSSLNQIAQMEKKRRGRPRKHPLKAGTPYQKAEGMGYMHHSTATTPVSAQPNTTIPFITKTKQAKTEAPTYGASMLPASPSGSGGPAFFTDDESKDDVKQKSPSERAKEEAELVGLGANGLERHISELQNMMKSVKHKHRKGTVCPRCTNEQKLRMAVKARAKCDSR